MIEARKAFPGAHGFLPAKQTLPALETAAQLCRGCDLYLHATQAVLGEGPADARLFLIGEQPGNEEDLEGHPFVGPAGRLLDRALREAGIVREQVYVTNAVKHFKFEERGKRRIHKKPGAGEVQACRPWLQAELNLLQPLVIGCLGATASQALLGSSFRLTQERGRAVESALAPHAGKVVATVHPSAILRAPDHNAREIEFRRFVDDLKRMQQLLH